MPDLIGAYNTRLTIIYLGYDFKLDKEFLDHQCFIISQTVLFLKVGWLMIGLIFTVIFS